MSYNDKNIKQLIQEQQNNIPQKQQEDHIANFLLDTIKRTSFYKTNDPIKTEEGYDIDLFARHPEDYFTKLDDLIVKREFSEARILSKLVLEEKKRRENKNPELSNFCYNPITCLIIKQATLQDLR